MNCSNSSPTIFIERHGIRYPYIFDELFFRFFFPSTFAIDPVLLAIHLCDRSCSCFRPPLRSIMFFISVCLHRRIMTSAVNHLPALSSNVMELDLDVKPFDGCF
ncbi:unnamed protein product [Cuscuta epithymum]|uniref:Uncharacterized protein n=1 Tax=Cuscuta epithymum TaxID=186058 RepID=A0AAV0F9P8_9ASTE|nr:unnamed protein product [Cuscuta epithymum]CAH9132251.1 unnamed protein product [Cuscuta epithymum]